MNDLLATLNKEQRAAAEYLEGPLLIMAGAGSGKTRVLTYRIANLLAHNVAPYNILAITFTNKAALEMKERAEKLIGAAAKNVWLSTFHSFCARFLRREIENLPHFKSNFVIYDTADSTTLIKNCLKEANLDVKIFPPAAILNKISGAKNKMQSPDKFISLAMSEHDRQIGMLYEMYQKKLLDNNALDFDDLLTVTVELLQNVPAVTEKYQDRFRYILVDEYQDTNGAQYQITKLLAAKHKNICVVGDADQSIYGWRGADMRNIMSFERDYPTAKTIMLEQNYRSTKNILAAANAVIANNINRKPKNLWTNAAAGTLAKLYEAEDEWDEAYFVAETVAAKHREGVPYGDIAILYRMNAQSRVMEEKFMQYGIPYSIVGGLKFYDRKEIKDILAYLRLIYNPFDDVSFNRIINVPKCGLGATSMQKISEFAATNGMSMFDVVADEENLAQIASLSKRAVNKLTDFAAMIYDFMGLATEDTVENLVKRVLTDTGYMKELEDDSTPENETRLNNLKEFVNVAGEFSSSDDAPTLENFLSQVALVADIDNADMDGDQVTFMTFHSAKGLEFPTVFMIGMDEGIFPHSRAMLENAALEEERRTCYVGITRAEKELYFTTADTRMVYGKENCYTPSRFINEIPPAYIEKVQLGGATETNEQKQGTSYAKNGRGVHFAGSPPSALNTAQAVATSQFYGGAKKFTLPASPFAKQTNAAAAGKTSAAPIRPDVNIVWKVGDKARHGMFGIGTVVSVKGSGEETQIQIAFADKGIKAFTQKYAPIEKI